jgi:uncharacterized protein YcbX
VIPHHDEGPVSLLTTASLRGLSKLSGGEPGGGDLDPLRFRANLLIDVAGGGFPENDWSGRRLRVGSEVVLRVILPLTRCVMIDMAQDHASERKDLLKILAEHREMTFGVVAVVEQPGSVAVGDACSWA